MEATLVLCKKGFETGTSFFRTGQIFRAMPLIETDNKQWMIFGEVFDAKAIGEQFELLHELIIREWTAIGIIKDGKPVSKTAFSKILHIANYGRGRTVDKAGYIWLKHPKECLYQFRDSFRIRSNKDMVEYAYSLVVSVVGGDIEAFDPVYGTIHRGNGGLPLINKQIYWKTYE